MDDAQTMRQHRARHRKRLYELRIAVIDAAREYQRASCAISPSEEDIGKRLSGFVRISRAKSSLQAAVVRHDVEAGLVGSVYDPRV